MKKNLSRLLLCGLAVLFSKSITAQCGINFCAPTVEYDNFISGFHQTVVRDNQGKFQIWGQFTARNGTGDRTVVTEVNATNYSGLTGIPLKMGIGSSRSTAAQTILLTTTGLFAWGTEGTVLNASVPGTSVAFDNLTDNGDGLPAGVDPEHVKMMFATNGTLAIVTCTGAGYVLTNTNSLRGDNGSGSTSWAQVKINSTTNLTGIEAIRGNRNTLMALTSNGDVYTWGTKTLLGTENSASQNVRSYATKMTLPEAAGTPVKMIGVVNDASEGTNPATYFVLYTSGKLYAMGQNSSHQLGDFGTTSSPSSASRKWVQPRYASGGATMDDIKWISPNEHDGAEPSINVINTTDRIWNWGSNDGLMLGRSTSESDFNPGQPLASAPFNPTSSIILGVETGGHTTMIAQKCQEKFGYVGHATSGSAANGSDTNWDKFVFSTAPIQICGYETGNVVLNEVTANVTINSPIQLDYLPTGGTFSIVSGPATVSSTGILNITGKGEVKVSYTKSDACSPTTVTISIKANQILYNLTDDFNNGVIKRPIPGNVSTNDITGATYGTPSISSAPSGSNSSNTSITMNSDGTYTFNTTVPGIYKYNVPVCPTGVSSGCPTTELIITVTDPTATNNKPHADLDQATTKAGTSTTIDLRQNDGPGNTGGTLGSPTITDSPNNGSATIDPGTGILTYTPNPGFTGKDTVTYQVCETPGNYCTTAKAIVTVLPDGTTDITGAADDYVNIPVGTTSVSGNVKTNDTDPQGRATSVTPQTITIPGKGDLVLNADGSYTFTPVAGFIGTVDIPYEVHVDGNTSVSANATLHIVVYNTSPLSVTFGNISARWVNGQLVIDFSTLKEKNNSLFEIEASTDGVNFTKIGELKSQVKDGNSDGQLNYSFEKNSTEIAFAISLLALGLALPFKRKIRWMVSTVAIAGILLFGFSCTKNDKTILENNDSLYIRIAQVDKDGSKSYSKVVKVVKE